MPKYFIHKATGGLVNKMTRKVNPNWEVPEGYEYIELEEDIHQQDAKFYKWNGKELIADNQAMVREQSLRRAWQWMMQRLPDLDWAKLSKMEKKLVVRKVPLTKAEENQLVAQWVAAGSPRV